MKENRKEQAFEHLKQQVLTLAQAPGESLDEASLSQQFGLSRTPLREVFQRLAGEGYINLEINKGASVSSMDLDTMRNFFQTAPMIYAAIARLAAEHATISQITLLKKTQSQFGKAVAKDAVRKMAVLNHQFHEQLGEMANSPYLTPSLRRLLIDHTRMSYRFYRIEREASRTRVLEARDQHDAMIAALEERKGALIVDLTLQHWELSRSEIDKYVKPDAFPIDTETHLAELG